MNFLGSTLQELLEYWAINRPDKVAFTYISGDGAISLSYKETFLKALALSKELQRYNHKSKCILNMYPAGLDFIIGFFACVLSGSVAVPVNMPKGNRSNEKILRIINDCNAKIVLSTKSGISLIKNSSDYEKLPEDLSLIPTEDYFLSQISENDFHYDCTAEEKDIAFLQYTSGSTSFPKGVEIRHKNLLYNLRMVKEAFEITEDSVLGTWLPHFHDMGLIGCILNAMYNGVTCNIISPLMFMKSPVSWLKMISDYKVTISGGPNFAYDYCVDKINNEQLTGINLSSWKIAYNGAEPVNYNSMVAFGERFKQAGFDFNSFYPCYGMAEASVFVSGNKISDTPKVIYIDYKELSRNNIKQVCEEKDEKNSVGFVCCGNTWLDQEIRIFDIRTNKALGENQVGEICVSGKNVAHGYWEKEDVNKEKFFVLEEGNNAKRFYRTGDFGFYIDGGLYITGRKDDVMIINGVNVYPQDIERIVEKSVSDLRHGTACAFEVSGLNEREIAVVVEVQRAAMKKLSSDEAYFKHITNKILESISNEFDFQIRRLAFLPPAAVCKTSSGKICRNENKKCYLSGNLPIIKEWTYDSAISKRTATNSRVNDMVDTFAKVNAAGFMQFKIFSSIVKILNSENAINIMDLDINKSLFFYGIDSLKIFDVHVALEKEYNVKIPTEIFFDSSDLLTVLNKIASVVENQNQYSVERTSVKLIDEIKKYEELVTEKLIEAGNKTNPVMSYDNLQNIFLTGGAGFVGGFILRECLLRTKANIFCLVRARNKEHGIERIVSNLANYNIRLNKSEIDRIKIVIGDISKDELGIDTIHYNEIAEKSDLVIHCAAIDNFYLPYSSLKAANVEGVKNIMIFSLHGKVKPMIYTASCSASLIDDNMNSDRLFGMINGYSQTKYVAQELLLNLINKGFPGVCVKLGYLYANEAHVVHPQEGFESLISSIYNIGAVPTMDADFDLTSVEYVAEAITDMALNYPASVKENYILYNPKPLYWKDVIKSFKKIMPEIKEVSLEEFVWLFQNYVHNSGVESLKFVSRVVSNLVEEQFNKMFRSVKCDSVDKYIHKCPACDELFSDYYIDMVIKLSIENTDEFEANGAESDRVCVDIT